MMEALSEYDRPADSAKTTETLAEDKEYLVRPKDLRQQRIQQGLDDGPKESTTTTEASAQKYEHGDYNNDKGGVSKG